MLVKKIERGEDLRREFEAYNRGDNFSYCACDALVEYFNEFDENIELSVIGICCDFSEYTEDELVREYDGYGKTAEEIAEAIADETWIVTLENGNYLLQAF